MAASYGAAEASGLVADDGIVAPIERRRPRPRAAAGGLALAACALAAVALARRASPSSAASSSALRAARAAAAESHSLVALEKIECGAHPMKLSCDAKAKVHMKMLGADALSLTMKYWPKGEKRANRTLFSSEHVVNGTAYAGADLDALHLEVPLYRLRPGHEYVAELWAKVNGSATNGTLGALGSLVGTLEFTSEMTGYDIMDYDVIASISKGTPSYGLLMFDLASDDGVFEGVVAIDNAGWTVWYYDAGSQVLAFDMFDSHDVAMNILEGGTVSTLTILKPSGDVYAEYDATCTTDSNLDWVQLNHECRVNTGGTGVLSVYQTVEVATTSETYVHEAMEYYFNDHVVQWDVASGELEILYSIETAFANPIDNYLDQPSSMTYDPVSGCGDSTDSLSVLDWSHSSAVSESADAYVVSMRNINTVAAFSKSGDGLLWSLSSSSPTIDSTLSFKDASSKFYDVHDAQLIKEDELLLMDDGNNREGCTQEGYDDEQGCFTRAVKYVIDWNSSVAELAWQFEFDVESSSANTLEELEDEDLFVTDGGSVTPWDEDYIYVAFTVTDSQSSYGSFAWIFEVDKEDADNILAEVRIARSLWSSSQSGLYRAVPYTSLYGEAFNAPFDLDDAE